MLGYSLSLALIVCNWLLFAVLRLAFIYKDPDQPILLVVSLPSSNLNPAACRAPPPLPPWGLQHDLVRSKQPHEACPISLPPSAPQFMWGPAMKSLSCIAFTCFLCTFVTGGDHSAVFRVVLVIISPPTTQVKALLVQPYCLLSSIPRGCQIPCFTVTTVSHFKLCLKYRFPIF